MNIKPLRIQEKINKLLALAKSDNPYEAERAQSQANALIKIMNGPDMLYDMFMQTTKNTIKFDHIKQSDFNILSSVCAVTGTRHRVFHTKKMMQPLFAGHHKNVEKAVYLYDLIIDQLNENKSKLAVQLTIHEIELYSLSFSNSVNTKLYDTFGFEPADEQTQAFAIHQFGRTQQNIVKTQINAENKNPIEKACSWTGFRAGEKIKLELPEEFRLCLE